VRAINERVYGPVEPNTSTLSEIDEIIERIKTTIIDRRASSVFVEYARFEGEDAGRVRMNLQGDLVEVMRLSFRSYELLANALLGESLSGTTKNTQVGQRGKLSYHVDGRQLNLRLSSVPIYHDERSGLIRLVIRVLRGSAFLPPLDRLGILPHHQRMIRAHIDRALCTMLIGAPPGEGKSTTQYAVLASLPLDVLNVITIEDPPEITFPALTQMPVHTAQDWTTAAALTETLRQEPHLIYVGEMIDYTVAQLVMSANKRGVRMASTVHSDDAIAIPATLRNFGIAPAAIAAVTALGSQRLTQVLCPQCRLQTEITPEVARHLRRLCVDRMPGRLFDRGPGCPHCKHRGIIRRRAVLEFFEVTEPMRVAIERGDDRELTALARQAGYVTMLEEAIILMLRGEIAQSAINRFPDVSAHTMALADEALTGNYRTRLALAATRPHVAPLRLESIA
jgi:general secretion pathway protein E